MKVVIDILDELYQEAVEKVRGDYPYYESFELHKAIRSGTPLPKGHGRLIDADEIQFENNEFDTYGDYSMAFDTIDYAPTIIEADKE